MTDVPDLTFLPERYQKIVSLRLDGLTYGDIAAQFGVSRARVDQILHRSAKKVRMRFGDAVADDLCDMLFGFRGIRKADLPPNP